MPRHPIEATEELLDSIIEHLSSGDSLLKISQMEEMPSRMTIIRWMDNIPGFGIRCARARELGADAYFEKLSDINNKVEDGALEPKAASIISSNLQWMASKLKPRKYGDSATLKDDANNPLAAISVTGSVLDALSLEQLQSIKHDIIEKKSDA